MKIKEPEDIIKGAETGNTLLITVLQRVAFNIIN
jgi:hypothetical protein